MVSEFARAHGFVALEDNIIAMHLYGRQHAVDERRIDEFEATLNTMRTLAQRCSSKQPHQLAMGKLKDVRPLNSQRARRYCELCGQPTELYAYQIDESKWESDQSTAYFSGRYCVAHRPQNHDGTFNPVHKRAVRQKSRFENEVARLEKQTGTIKSHPPDPDRGGIDQFTATIIRRDALYLVEEGILRDIACLLVKANVSDRKKEIVSLLSCGKTRIEVAFILDISEQAVSKALNSVPRRFRFDLPCDHIQNQRNVAILPGQIAEFLEAAFDDPSVHEIHLNDDEKLWAVGPGESRRHLGTMNQTQATKLLAWVGEHLGQAIDDKNPFIEGDLPAGSARFFAVAPPVVDRITFAIRKRRA